MGDSNSRPPHCKCGALPTKLTAQIISETDYTLEPIFYQKDVIIFNMELLKIKPKTSEILFLVTGLGMLITLPLVEAGSLKLWLFLKSFYILGLIFFIIERIRE